MQSNFVPQGRSSWPTWAGFLRRHGLENVAVLALEGVGPLAILGAQVFYLAGPLLPTAWFGGQVNALAGLLEDQQETLAFAAFLREEIHS